MGANLPVFLDTNILLRYMIKDFPEYAQIKAKIDALIQTGYVLWINRQVIREFGRVCTRPQTFMQMMSPIEATKYMHTLITLFEVANEDAQVTTALIALMQNFGVSGKEIHDANIVATMQVYGIHTLLTLNLKDFMRYQPIITLL